MSKPRLFTEISTKDLLTENGMATHSSSGSFVVDFYYKMGGFRKNASEPLGNLVSLFFSAYGENPNLALKALLNLRDPRQGMGERNSARAIWHFFAKAHPEIVQKFIPYIAEYGRWDDLWAFIGTSCEKVAVEEILQGLRKGDALCAKWMPREKKSEHLFALYFMKIFSLNPREYRKLLAGLTNVVETKMCQKRWGEINFQHVPSQAMKIYRNAFRKHEPERFGKFLEKVASGEAKINTATLSPVDIVHQYGCPYPTALDTALEALWTNLRDVVPPEISFLPIADVSGSMNGTPMEVAISLGIYLAQRNKSVFKNGLITFSDKPVFHFMQGKTLHDRIVEVGRMDWGGSTNLQAVFELILNTALRAKLSPEELPTHLMIISDMQFNGAVNLGRGKNSWERSGYAAPVSVTDTALEMLDKMFTKAGYKRPNIFFWNVRTSEGVPAKMDENGVGLVSGYSPNLLRSVLSGDLNPINQVMVILNSPRYEIVDKLLG